MQRPMSASSPNGRLEIQSVVDHVYTALRERILSGDLPRASKLRQVSLADEMGVSRTPLREALRRLAAEGLVDFSPNRGATVSELDFGDMRHAWSARVALEPGAARLAADRGDAGAIAAMRSAVAEQRRVGDDRDASFAANRRFHLSLAAASGNPHLTRFAEMLWVPRIGVPIYQAQAVEPSGAQAWAGMAIVPGLTDSHVHPFLGAMETRGADLAGAATVDEVRARLADERRRCGEGAWITGHSLEYRVFDGIEASGELFEQAVGGNPALLTFFDFHTALATPPALAAASVTSARTFEDASEIVVRPDGRPTGELRERAIQLVAVAMPEPSRSQRLA